MQIQGWTDPLTPAKTDGSLFFCTNYMGSLGRDLTVTKFLFTTAVGVPDEWGSQESTDQDTSTHRTETHTREIASASQPLSVLCSSYSLLFLFNFLLLPCLALPLRSLSETLKGARFCFGAERAATAVLLFPVPKRRVAASRRESDQIRILRF